MRYSEKFKKDFREKMREILFLFFEQKIECKIFIRNFNNWDLKLPEYLKEANVIELDLADEVFDFCFIEDDKLILNMVFGEELYSKTLDMYELIGIFDTESSPIIYKPFEDLKSQEEAYTVLYDEKKGIIHCLIDDTVIVI